MDIIDKKFLINHGFQEDVGKEVLLKLFTTNQKFKEVNISVSCTEPAMLLARSKEKNVVVQTNSIHNDRLILKRGNTVIMNIILGEINNCLVKRYNDSLYEYEFEVHDFRYSFFVSV